SASAKSPPIPRRPLGRTSHIFVGKPAHPRNRQFQPDGNSCASERPENVDGPVSRQERPINGAISGGDWQVQRNGRGSASGNSGSSRDISDQNTQLGLSIS